jgi:U3 small nucleolar RNA-associated protein 23
MAQYTLPPFSFREPYQVLLDAAFLRACHAFHMPLQKFLENTLHGKCRLFVTRCSLAKIMGNWEREQKKAGNVGKGGEVKGRPEFLPPPTEVPLRYCKHNDEETAVEEVDCLIDLLAGQPKGNEQVKNKQHFVLATAEPTDAEKRKAGRGFVDVREAARNVPGVPIVYVKRSVMVLEELSRASLRVKGEVERERLKEGLVGGAGRKRKREDEEDGKEEGKKEGKEGGEGGAVSKGRVVKKVKGPNPLSVKKKKPKPQRPKEDDAEDSRRDQAKPNKPQDGDDVPKAKRRRKHKSKKGDEPGDSEVGTVNSVAAASLALQEVVA